jgi:hypothetical protein
MVKKEIVKMKTKFWISHLWRMSLLGPVMMLLVACATPGREAPTTPPTPNPTLTVAGGGALQPSPVPPTAMFPAATPTLPPPPGGFGSPACENPYLPVRLGATWDYQLIHETTDTFTRSVIEVTADGFVDQDEFAAGAVRQGRWQCKDGNLIYLTPGPVAGSVFAGEMQTDVTLESNEGFYHPADLRPGQTWHQKTVFRGQSTLEGEIVVETRTEANYACRAEDFETITVPAGTFDALRVTCEVYFTTSVAEGMTFEIEEQSTQWLARGVGMVKSVGQTEGAPPNTIELLSYRLP